MTSPRKTAKGTKTRMSEKLSIVLSAASLFVAIAAWTYPDLPSSLGHTKRVLFVASISIFCLLTYLAFFKLMVLVARKDLGQRRTLVAFAIALTLNSVFFASAGAWFRGIATTSNAAGVVSDMAVFSGKLDINEFCKSAYGALYSFNGDIVEPACINSKDRKEVNISEACLWFSGSSSYDTDSADLAIMCDTSKMSPRPCNSQQRPCGGNPNFCCPQG